VVGRLVERLRTITKGCVECRFASFLFVCLFLWFLFLYEDSV
jgi:hypothetical protein